MAKSFLAAALWCWMLYVPAVFADEDAGRPSHADNKAAVASIAFDAIFSDGGNLRLFLEVDRLEFETPYGALLIPTADIRKFELALRLSAVEQKRVEEAIFKLGSSDFSQRTEASQTLLELGAKAYPAVLKAAKHADLEVAQRSKDMAAKLREILSEEQLAPREHDVIETDYSRIAGRLTASRIAVRTSQFGKQQLELSDVRSLVNSAAASERVEGTDVGLDPGNLLSFHGSIGKTLAFKVTGRIDGSVYGTGVYTTDSNLATAAVHSGALKVGETGVVRVTMLASPPAFASSTQNGITSSAWSVYPAAYQVVVPKKR